MLIRSSAKIIGLILIVVVGALVCANVYGFYNMRAEREQLRNTYDVDAAVLDLNVLAAEMQLRRSDRVRRQFDDRIGRLEELLQKLRLEEVNNSQVLARMIRHSDRFKQTFLALEETLDSTRFSDEQRVRAVRALTQSFLASTTALASLSERLTGQLISRIERIEDYLVVLNISSALILIGLLLLISYSFRRLVLLPILKLRARIEGIADIESTDARQTDASRNELEEISAEFDRRIAALRQAEEVQEKFAEELQRSNKELEQFAYVASHDLRAPLKGIKMTASWVAEDMAEYMNDDTRESLDLLQSRAERLDELLNSLLQYSRVRSKRHEVVSVDVADVVDEVVLLLSLADGVSVKVLGKLPSIFAERLHLQQVIQNLIENAVKHHDRETVNITISVDDAGPFWRFSIEDDGPGIPSQYHEKVQQIFQTLVRRDEREASGMGLALVKKIIEQNSGKLTIDSPLNDGRGCAMRFTWPKERSTHANV